jgi:hypothetical protein
MICRYRGDFRVKDGDRKAATPMLPAKGYHAGYDTLISNVPP